MTQSTSDAYFATAGGNVGIGTTTPQWKTQISTTAAPQLALSDSGLLTSNHFSFRNSNGILYIATSSPTSFATSTTPSLTIDGTTGNVGIGTASPSFKLDVSGNTRIGGVTNGSEVLHIGTTAVIDAVISSGDNMYFNTDSTNAGTGNIFAWGTNRAGNAGGTELMRLNDSGNLGIGTTAPGYKFHVAGAIAKATDSGEYLAFLGSSDASNPLGLSVYIRDNPTAGSRRIALQSEEIGASTWRDLTLQDSGGNVGIGTTAPAKKLHVVGSADDILWVERTSADSNPNIGIKNDAKTYLLQTVGARSDNFEIWDNDNSATRLAANSILSSTFWSSFDTNAN